MLASWLILAKYWFRKCTVMENVHVLLKYSATNERIKMTGLEGKENNVHSQLIVTHRLELGAFNILKILPTFTVQDSLRISNHCIKSYQILAK